MSNELDSSYEKLMKKYKELALFDSVRGLVRWDMETKMPPKATDLRGEQLALLQRLGHRMISDPAIKELLVTIRNHPDYETLDAFEKRNVHLIKKRYDEEAQLPEELLSDLTKQRATTINIWKKAKAAEDFSMFQPELEKLLELKREQAKRLMEVKETDTPYDALIDMYEPNMTAALISEIFTELRKGLERLTEQCVTSPKQPATSFLHRTVPIQKQQKLSKALVDFLEYNIEGEAAGGRIDETEHPFTSGYYEDVRITTHYHEDDFTASLFSVLHEGGHAIHAQHQPQDWKYQPVGSSPSGGVSESQSRFVENIIGRSSAFWQYFYPRLREITNGIFSDVDRETFVHAINKVEPSKIRIKADEVTYCLHIIIRFELERELILGNIDVSELPAIWNQKYEDYLGVKIENPSEGVMQDTHWASGMFGYFPSYALGNIYAGQLYATMENDISAWRRHIENGNFHPIKEWLIDNVYTYGALYDPRELIKEITGEKINVKYFLDYLQEKYSKLYGF